MPNTFYLFQILYLLVFAQAKVLQLNGGILTEKRSIQMSITVIIGWIACSILFVYFGIEYSWMTTFIGSILSAILSGMIILLFPPIYLICKFWPLLFITLLILEFYK